MTMEVALQRDQETVFKSSTFHEKCDHQGACPSHSWINQKGSTFLGDIQSAFFTNSHRENKRQIWGGTPGL